MVDQITKQLQDPILDQGIENTNYFNGRLLTAADLQTDQTANRQQHQQLGQAIGAGVVQGLRVTVLDDGSAGGPPVVQVTSGLALNRLGHAISLPADVHVALARQLQGPPTGAELFAPCEPPKSGTTPVTAGIYILVASPASGYQGKAPMRSFGSNGKVTGCGSKYAIEGVQFRLVELLLTAAALPRVSSATITTLNALLAASDAASLSMLRNLVAHLCFGTEELTGFPQDPLSRTAGPSPQSSYTTYGALDDLRAAGTLTDCDVPLALLYLTIDGVQFLDLWSVRRRVIRQAVEDQWPLLVGDRRAAEAEATFLQFEQQIQDIRNAETSLTSIAAARRFAYLPPVGLLPITGQGSPAGFDPSTFFGNRASGELATIDGNLMRSLFHEARYHEPIGMSAADPIQLYLIWENFQAVQAQQVSQLTLLFASHTLPYRGIARFDYAHWDLSRFAPKVL